MTDHLPPKTADNGTAENTSDMVEKRRRLLKIGASSAPVLMTLSSRSAFGCTTGGNCVTPSAFGSYTLNNSHAPKKETCSGRTPGYWKQEQWFSQWPAPYYPTTVAPAPGVPGHTATKFHSVFGGSVFGTKTLLTVLHPQPEDPQGLGRHIVAALLNAASGLTPVLSVSLVITIWNDYVSKGYYQPTAGIKWDAAQIVTYLQSTQTV